MKIHDIEFEPYISGAQIETAIDVIARQINEKYAQIERPVLMLVTLTGAMIFASDLCKRLTIPLEIAFVKCSSYGESLVSSGHISFDLKPTSILAERDVIVLEDIVDTGNTWVVLHDYINSQGAKSIAIATLVLKEEVYDKPLKLDYVAFNVENAFLIGYGMDYNQLGRNINGIYKPTSC